jgi:hypothetical protein
MFFYVFFNGFDVKGNFLKKNYLDVFSIEKYF